MWNYEQATAFLFGELALTMRDVEFNHTTHDNGKMSFRVSLPLKRAKDFKYAAADGQMGCLMKLYRDWQLSGDDKMLKKAWPNARKALEFCWIKNGWDADCDGVMEGCQHNTMDVEYYGPNPQMQSWYLGALRAMEEMADYLGESEFAEKCRTLFSNGRTEFHSHFNCLRSFALNDEKALLMASYPLGRRPEIPFPYFTEVMTGFEYTAAVGMVQEGMSREGLACIANIRERYDGRRRSPFNEAECGHHYARAMASWAAVVALSGFQYSAVSGAIAFAANPGVYFWSTGHAWGQCVVKKRGKGFSVVFSVTRGKIVVREFRLGTKFEWSFKKPSTLSAGRKVNVDFNSNLTHALSLE